MNILIIFLTGIIVGALLTWDQIKRYKKAQGLDEDPLDGKEPTKGEQFVKKGFEKAKLNVSGIKVVKVNGKTKLTVDGREVDHESEEGKRILKTTQAQMDLLGEEMSELGNVLKKNFDEVFDNMNKLFKGWKI